MYHVPDQLKHELHEYRDLHYSNYTTKADGKCRCPYTCDHKVVISVARIYLLAAGLPILLFFVVGPLAALFHQPEKAPEQLTASDFQIESAFGQAGSSYLPVHSQPLNGNYNRFANSRLNARLAVQPQSMYNVKRESEPGYAPVTRRLPPSREGAAGSSIASVMGQSGSVWALDGEGTPDGLAAFNHVPDRFGRPASQ